MEYANVWSCIPRAPNRLGGNTLAGLRAARPSERREHGEDVAGSGLGLYITRHILRMHGCNIKARSPEGAGAVFEFTLPLASESAPETTPQQIRRRHSSGR